MAITICSIVYSAKKRQSYKENTDCGSLFVRLWFYTWHLFCPYIFFTSPSFGASGGLCVVIVAFPGYFHLHFYT